MKSHAIVAAALAAASAFAQPGVTSSGFPAASPHDAVAQATHRSPARCRTPASCSRRSIRTIRRPIAAATSGRSHSGMRM